MTRARVVAAVLSGVLTGVLLLTGCTQGDPLVRDSAVAVATPEPFTSANDRTVAGATDANTAIVDATSSRFFAALPDGTLEPDPSFGSAEVTATDPLTVRYTLTDVAVWSDGVPLDGADLLFAWVATSGRFASSGVDFDVADGRGLEHATRLPQLGTDGRSITIGYDEAIADWQLAFEVGLPAHVVAEAALGPFEGEAADEAAKTAVVEAIQSADIPTLAKLADAWNSGFDAEELASHPERMAGSGPYIVTAVEPGVSVTLGANPRYAGSHRPSIETVVVRSVSDPLEAVRGLADGTFDVIQPVAGEAVVKELAAVEGVTVQSSTSAAFEHLDLQFADSRSGLFDDPLVREAFLAVVPRELIAGTGVRRDSFVFAPGEAGYDEAVADNGSSASAEVDLERSRLLLAEAGVANPAVCVLFDPANERRVATFELIRESAAAAGFVVTDCSRADWQRALGANGAYDAALFAWSPGSPAASVIDDRLRSDSAATNLTRYASDAVDGLLDELRGADAAQRLELLAAIDAELWSDGYGVPLFQHPRVSAWNWRVEGVSATPWAAGVLAGLWRWQPTAGSESASPSR